MPVKRAHPRLPQPAGHAAQATDYATDYATGYATEAAAEDASTPPPSPRTVEDCSARDRRPPLLRLTRCV